MFLQSKNKVFFASLFLFGKNTKNRFTYILQNSASRFIDENLELEEGIHFHKVKIVEGVALPPC